MISHVTLGFILSSFSLILADSYELNIDSKPADAQVFINGKSAGPTPLNLKDLSPGGYLIRVEKSGHKTWKKAVQLAGPSSLEIKLEPLPFGTITFKATPVSGEVIINGRPRGETPIELKLSAGTQRVEIEAEGYFTSQQTIEVSPDQAQEIAVDLKSRAESFLLTSLEETPWRVAYAYELAHHYLVKRNGPKALEALELGLRASIDYRAPTGEAGRLAQEIGSFYSGQFKFDASQFPGGIQPEILKMLKRVAADQPRNMDAIRTLAAYLPAEESLELIKKTITALKSERSQRYFRYLASTKAYPIASKVLAKAHPVRQQWVTLEAASQKSKKKPDIDAAAAKKLESDKAYQEALKAFEDVIAIFPQGGHAPSAHTNLIAIYQSYLLDSEKYAAAVHRYSTAFLDPAVTYRQQLGAYRFERKEYVKAIQEYRSVLKDYPNRDDSLTTHQQVVDSLIMLKKDADAAKEYEAMLRLYRDADYPAATIGKMIPLYEKLGNKARAEQLKSELTNNYPHTATAVTYDKDPQRISDRAESQKLFDATLAGRTAVTQKKAELTRAQAALVKLENAKKAMEAEQKKKAEEEKKKAEEEKKKPQQGEGQPATKQAKESTTKTEKPRKKKKKKNAEEETLSPEDLKIAEAKNEIEKLEQEVVTSAAYVIGRLRPVTLKYRKYATARTAQKTIIQIAQSYLAYEDYIEAMREYIELFPDDVYCHTLLPQIAQQYSAKKMNDEAIREYRKFLKDYPESNQCPQIHYTLINLMLDKNDLSRRAAWAVEIVEFIKLYPKNSYCPSLLYSRAMVYYYRSFPGDEELCVESFQLFGKMFPNHNSALSCERYRTFIDDGMQAVESRIEPQLKVDKWGAK
jgi:tetratricopeptide (TPR) repeat protein